MRFSISWLKSLMNMVVTGLIFICNHKALAQQYGLSQVKVMHYNVLNYGLTDSVQCIGLNTENKHGYLRTILKYADPDIIGLVKMYAKSDFVKDSIKTFVLDSVCLNCFESVSFANQSGYWKTNHLYFKKQKFGYLKSTPLHTSDTLISDLRLHLLYYKDSIANPLGDTIYINIIQCHLLSGDTTASIRGMEIQEMMDSLQIVSNPKFNHLILGDFNSRKDAEPCIQNIVNPANTNWRFFDPSNQMGNWDSLPKNYANYLTISTRNTSLDDCGSSGGMDEIYDHIFANDAIMNGTKGIQYVDTTYHVLGQDGLHVNKGLLDKPKNVIAPYEVIKALYYMSNHLPVQLSLNISTVEVYAGTIQGPKEICKGNIAQLEVLGSLGNINWLFLNKGTWTPWPYTLPKLTVSPNKNMQFRVVAEKGGKYDTTVAFELVVNDPKIVFNPAGPLHACSGDSILISVNSASDYSWNTGEKLQSIWVKQAGTYVLTAFDALGCSVTDSVIVLTWPLPNADFTLLPVSNTGLYAFIASDTTLSTYHWDFGDGIKGTGDTIIHQYNQPNSYTVVLETKDSNGCVNSSSKQVDVSLGIHSLPHLVFADVNPNPFVGHTFLRYMANADASIKISLLDVSGKLIKDEIIYNQTLGIHYFEVIVPNPGVYFIQLNMGGNTSTFKLVAL